MRRWVRGLGMLLGVGILPLAGWLTWRAVENREPAKTPDAATTADAADQPVATVTTAQIRAGDIAQTLTAYGSVAAEPGSIVVQSVRVDARVVHLHVVSGQAVAKGAPLIDMEGSADTKLQLLTARNGLAAAKKDLDDTQQRFNLKLATNTELLQAKQDVQSAQLKLDDLQDRGLGDGVRTLRAEADSLVSKIDVQEGQLVPASAPLVELLPRNQVDVRLGVEASSVPLLAVGQAVHLTIGDQPSAGLDGVIGSLTQRVNPDTRLVDIFVTPPPGVTLLLDSVARGDITLRQEHALLVPRDAVLPGDQGSILFTVKDAHAVKHTVTVGVQNDQEAAVSCPDLHEGDTVVVQGALEIDDGVAVATAPANATAPVATAPDAPAADATAPAPTTGEAK